MLRRSCRVRPRGHDVSANSLGILEACAQQFRWTYGPREVRLPAEAPGVFARIGDLWHRALATIFRDRASWGVEGPTNERELLSALDAVGGESSFHAEALLSARELVADGVRRVSAYLDHPTLSPLVHEDGGVWVERGFVRSIGDESLSLPGGDVAVRVGGIFDLVLASADGRRVVIVDWKTGPGSFLGWRDAQRDPQVLLYLAAAASLWPDAEEIEIHLVWIGLDAEPTVVRWSLELDDAAVALARSAVRTIATATDWPANPGEACSRCNFHRYCEARREWIAGTARGRGERSVSLAERDDDDLARVVEDRSARAKEAAKDAEAAKAELRRRIEDRGEVIARGRRFFHRVVAEGAQKLEAPAPRQAHTRLASEPVDEDMAPVAGASTPLLPVPQAPATGPLSRTLNGEAAEDVLAAAKARTDAFLATVRAQHTPGESHAGPGPVAAPAPTEPVSPPTLPAEDAPALSAGGVSLAETDEDARERYLEALTLELEAEIAAEVSSADPVEAARERAQDFGGDSDEDECDDDPDDAESLATMSDSLPPPQAGGLPW